MANDVTGLAEVDRFFAKFTEKVDKIAVEATEKGADLILETSKRLAPRVTGRMINEADVVKTKANQVEVRYNTDYALYVHEDLEAIHPNGQAKFLETATNQEGPKVAPMVAKAIQKLGRSL